MVVAEVTVIPVGTRSPSLSKYVARALDKLKDSDLEYELTPTGTILEGDLTEVIEMAKKMHSSVFGEGIERVVTEIRIDERRDADLTMAGKKKSVGRKMKNQNSTNNK